MTELINKKNEIIRYFSDTSFIEDTHTYYLNNKKLNVSVSGIIKNFVEEVDFDSISFHIDKRDGLPLGTSRKLWNLKSEYACSKGNRAHYFGEIYAFNRTIIPSLNQEKAIVKFWNDLPEHIIPVFTELIMSHKICKFGGMADIILYNTLTKKFIIADYKTNEDLTKNFKVKTLKSPFKNLLDNDYNKYQLQFSFYQILFEQTKFKVEKRILVHLLESGEYKMYFTEDYTESLKNYLKNVFS